jgi:hypothetical protein
VKFWRHTARYVLYRAILRIRRLQNDAISSIAMPKDRGCKRRIAPKI